MEEICRLESGVISPLEDHRMPLSARTLLSYKRFITCPITTKDENRTRCPVKLEEAKSRVGSLKRLKGLIKKDN
jgi:hypothetical protein